MPGDSTPTSASWKNHAVARLSEAGYHRGGGRAKVVDLLAGQGCAITAMEIDSKLDGVGRATVYRALDQLEQLGLVQRIDLGLESSGYERVDPAAHHHHMVCSNCSKVIPFEDEALEKAIREISDRDGFVAESHEVTLRGLCGDCAD